MWSIKEQIVEVISIDKLKKITDFFLPTILASGVIKTKIKFIKNKYKNP